MTFQTITFYLFSFVLILSALGVITSRNPVYAALFLVLSFVTAAGLWMLLFAEFLALTLILVYVGAVMVLFLFVVMMIDVNLEKLKQGFWNNFPLAASIGAVLALELASVLMGGFRSAPAPAPVLDANGGTISNTKELGIALYTDYLYPLEVAAVILLVAIIAAIALTMRKRQDNKLQDPAEQIKVKPADRLRMVKVDPVHQALVPPPAPEEPKA